MLKSTLRKINPFGWRHFLKACLLAFGECSRLKRVVNSALKRCYASLTLPQIFSNLFFAHQISCASCAAFFRSGTNTVIKWRQRFSQSGLTGLSDAPRPQAKPVYDRDFPNRVLAVLEQPQPAGQAGWDGPVVATFVPPHLKTPARSNHPSRPLPQ